METLRAENEQLKQENEELRKTLTEMLKRVKELEAQLNQNSGNSSWPSSRDKGTKKKKRRTKSLRVKSDKPVGGQPGHEGRTLELKDKVNRVKSHRPEECEHCREALKLESEVSWVERRQVIDLPPIEMEVVEHRVETVVCSRCGHETAGEFPSDVINPVQYGPRVKALAVYLKNDHFLPYVRAQRLMSDLFGATISPGTLQNFVHQAAKVLEPVTENIRAALKKEEVVHFDESGFYIEGKRQWLHSASSQQLTYYTPHPTRGKEAVKAAGILPEFTGTAVHDNWATYWSYDQCDHALCNVHHLRELNAIEEQFEQSWASRFRHFLLATKAVVDTAKENGLHTLSPEKLAQIERLYDRLVTAALAANPPPEDGWPRGKRGRAKKTKARNFAERLDKRRQAILAFAYDFKVPFDNNLAERDIRMLKVQQKVSGCFRSSEGARAFCDTRSYISSLRKQGINIWSALRSVFSQDPIVEPSYSPPV
jgi:transposase